MRVFEDNYGTVPVKKNTMADTAKASQVLETPPRLPYTAGGDAYTPFPCPVYRGKRRANERTTAAKTSAYPLHHPTKT